MSLEKREEYCIGVTPNRDWLAAIIANQFTCANERFFHTLQGAPSRFFVNLIGGDFLSILPRAGEGLVCFPEFVDTGSAGARESDRCRHTTGLGKCFQKEFLSRLGELQFPHTSGLKRVAPVPKHRAYNQWS